MPNPGLVGTIAYCLVVGQAAVPLGSLVVGPAFEGIVIPVAQHDRRDAASAWAPGETEVREAERGVRAFISSNEAGAALTGLRICPELANYKRQYWGVVRNGRRQLLISFIHRASPLGDSGRWKTTAVLLEGGGYPSSSGVMVQGGGERYFRVTYSVESKRFSQLQINSPI